MDVRSVVPATAGPGIGPRRSAARRRAERGATLVEFALAFSLVFWPLAMSVFTLGRAVFAWNGLTNAAFEGARTAAVNQTVATIQQRVVTQAVSLGVNPVTVTVTFTDNTGTGLPCSGGPSVPLGCQAHVVASHALQIPIIGAVTVSGSANAPVERTCPDPNTNPPLTSGTCLR